MQHTSEMIQTHPYESILSSDELAACIAACFDCEQSCTACADACLGEAAVAELVRCIRLNADCADVCNTTGRMLSRQTESEPQVIRAQLEACIAACDACATECERHAELHQHCRICGEACRTCEESCRKLSTSPLAA
jgi:hypothetical protein